MSIVTQEVNLYQPGPDARLGERVSFAAGTAGLFAAVLCAGLLGVWGFSVWRVEHLQRSIETLRREQQHQSETMAALAAARATGVSSEQMDATVAALGAELDVHTRALEFLQAGKAGDLTGFSARLSALARRPLAGLWLEHVAFSGLNGAMSIEGSALDPDLVPRYLHGLSAESALAGVRFDDFVIERPAGAPTGQSDPAARLAPAQPASAQPAPDRRFHFRAESDSLLGAVADARS